MAERLEDLIARAEEVTLQLAATEKHLADIAWKLAATRFMLSWVPGAVAGGIAGGIVALILLGAKVAGAH